MWQHIGRLVMGPSPGSCVLINSLFNFGTAKLFALQPSIMKRWKDSFRVRLRFRIRNRIHHHHAIIFTMHRNSDIAIIRSGAFFTSSTVLATGTTPARPAPNRTEVYYACRFVQRVRPQYKRMKTDFRPTAFPPLSVIPRFMRNWGKDVVNQSKWFNFIVTPTRRSESV